MSAAACPGGPVRPAQGQNVSGRPKNASDGGSDASPHPASAVFRSGPRPRPALGDRATPPHKKPAYKAIGSFVGRFVGFLGTM